MSVCGTDDESESESSTAFMSEADSSDDEYTQESDTDSSGKSSVNSDQDTRGRGAVAGMETQPEGPRGTLCSSCQACSPTFRWSDRNARTTCDW